MFEFLFKYRADLFAKGELVFQSGPLRWGLIVVAAAVAVWILGSYRRQLQKVAGVDRGVATVLVGLRLGMLAALCFVLMQPALALQALKPQEGFVALLADTSRSMTIEEAATNAAPSRAQWPQQSLLGSAEGRLGEGALADPLSERFRLRTYAFGDQVKRLGPDDGLTFDGSSTQLVGALERVRAELAGVPLAGVVVLTDGAIAAEPGFEDQILRYRQAGTPVHTVLVGSERFTRDLEIEQVVAPRSVLLGSSAELEVHLRYPGFGGERVVVEVRDGGRLLEQREVELPLAGDERTTVRAVFRTVEPGSRTFEVTVRPQDGSTETVERNNRRYSLVEVEEGPHKILYFEGEPRFEYKFIRRAVADDEQIQLVSLLRMAENRFYRQSVDDELELQGGFPQRKQDLFRYRGLVLGSVEASFFTYDQMRMIVDFAAERGGGVLFLGGSQALGEGGYAGTPLEQLFPVEINDRRQIGPVGRTVLATPTRLGASHPLLEIGEASSEADFWEQLPELLLINELGPVKAGAGALLAGAGGGEEEPILVQQPFGRGQSVLFAAVDSFRWQMRMPTDDATHEIFWRQLLRWLIGGAPDRLEAGSGAGVHQAGRPVELVATVRDPDFSSNPDARVVAEVRAPGGAIAQVPLDYEFGPEGRYRGVYQAPEEGTYEVATRVESLDDAQAALSHFDVRDLDEEFFGASANRSLLERLSRETGGEVFAPDELERLLDELSYSTAGVTVREEQPLWNMPILFVILLTCLLAEWSLRRWKGLR